MFLKESISLKLEVVRFYFSQSVVFIVSWTKLSLMISMGQNG